MTSRSADEPWLRPGSHARRGPADRLHLSPAQVQAIARTVRRAPEVMVKVLSQGAGTVKAVHGHLDYIGRHGEVELLTDDDQKLHGGAARQLLDDWDLDLEEVRAGSRLKPPHHAKPPRLVHKLVFSMPAGTPPEKVLRATQAFCREEFGLNHRYAAALHTDEPHPHVHVVVKAMSEQGVRLNIRKETLRAWRERFAHQLREQGIAANATPRFDRGETRPRKVDAIYRPAERDESTHVNQRLLQAPGAPSKGGRPADPARNRLLDSRQILENQWAGRISALEASGQHELAFEARRFVDSLPPVRTVAEWLVADASRKHSPSRSDRIRADREPLIRSQ